MIVIGFHVDEWVHLQKHYNFYIQNVKADHNYYKAALFAILVHIFYMNQSALNSTPNSLHLLELKLTKKQVILMLLV